MLGGISVVYMAGIIGLKLRINLPESVSAALVGIWVIVVSLFPYWLFGRYSAIGWYDEYDAIIPGHIFAALHNGTFLHGYAGGSAADALFFTGPHALSLYEAMICALGPQIASLCFRILGMFVLFFGSYLTARTLFDLRKRGAIVTGLAAVFSTAYPYAWTLGGYAWDIGVIAWVGLLIFAPMFSLVRVGCAAGLALVTLATTSIFFLAPWMCAYLVLLWILLPVKANVLLRRSGLAGLVYALSVFVGAMPAIFSLDHIYDEFGSFYGAE